jgi:ribosomal protein S8E
MEVTSTKIGKPAVESLGFRPSLLDAEPSEFRKWLVSAGNDGRRRIDTPYKEESIELSPGDAPNDRIAKSSQFGHCSPLTVLPKTEQENEVRESRLESHERLIRLMERQQAWYDARSLAESEAAKLLQIIDHHQSQWLTQRNSNSHVNP